MRSIVAAVPLLKEKVRLRSRSVDEFSREIDSSTKAILHPRADTTFSELISKVVSIARETFAEHDKVKSSR